MRLSEHFTLKELTYSETGKALGIDNIPSKEVIINLERLVNKLLEPLRMAYGKPIHINSGYRCALLNLKVGGTNRSQHLKGEAADCSCDDPKKLLSILLNSGLDFDQAILYPTFLHLSLRKYHNRKLVLRK